MALHTKTLSSRDHRLPGITGYWPSLSGAWRLIRATEFLGKFQQSFRLFGLQAAVYNRLNPRLPVLSSYRFIQPCMDGSFWGTAAEYSTLSRVRLFRSSVSGKKLESVMRFCRCLPMRGLEVCIIASGADDYRQQLTWRYNARQPSRSQLPRTHHAAASRPTLSLLLQCWWTWACHFFCLLSWQWLSGVDLARRYWQLWQLRAEHLMWHLLHTSLPYGCVSRCTWAFLDNTCIILPASQLDRVLVLQSMICMKCCRIRRAAASKTQTPSTTDEATHIAPFATVDISLGAMSSPVQNLTAHRPCYQWLLDFPLALKLCGKHAA